MGYDDKFLFQRVYILGYAPIMDAKVVADVQKPDRTIQSIILLDNGAGKLTVIDMNRYLVCK